MNSNDEKFELLQKSGNLVLYPELTTSSVDEEFLDEKKRHPFDGKLITMGTSGAHNCCYIHAFAGAVSPTYRNLEDGDSDMWSLGNDISKLTRGGFALRIKRDLVAKLISPYFDFTWSTATTTTTTLSGGCSDEDRANRDRANPLTETKGMYYNRPGIWSWNEKKMELEIKAYLHIRNGVDIRNNERIYEELQKGERRNYSTYHRVITKLSSQSEYTKLMTKLTDKLRRSGVTSDTDPKNITNATEVFKFLTPDDVKNGVYRNYSTYKAAMDIISTEDGYKKDLIRYEASLRKIRETPLKDLYRYYELTDSKSPKSHFAILPPNYNPSLEESKDDKLFVSTEVYRYLRGAKDILTSEPNLSNYIEGNSIFNGKDIHNDVKMGEYLLSIFDGTVKLPTSGEDGSPSWCSLLRNKFESEPASNAEIMARKEAKEKHSKDAIEYNTKAKIYNQHLDEVKDQSEQLELIVFTKEDQKYNDSIKQKNLSSSSKMMMTDFSNEVKNRSSSANGVHRRLQIRRILHPHSIIVRPIPPIDPSVKIRKEINARIEEIMNRAFRYARFSKAYNDRKKHPPAPFDNREYLLAHGIEEYEPIYDARWLQEPQSWARTCDLNIGFFCMDHGGYPHRTADFADYSTGIGQTDRILNFDDMFNHLILNNMNGMILANLLAEYLDINFILTGNADTSNPIHFIYTRTYLPGRNYVVIRLRPGHYEPVGVIEKDKNGKDCIRTVFDRNHKLIRILMETPLSGTR